MSGSGPISLPAERTVEGSSCEFFKPLGEVCDFVRGVSFDTGDVCPTKAAGLIPVLRAGNIQQTIIYDQDLIWIPEENASSDQLLRAGDILICMSSGSSSVVGKTCRVEKAWRGTVGAFCGIIRPLAESDSEYLALWFKSSLFTAWRDATARGANIQNLRFSDMANLEVPWPSPTERTKIAKMRRAQLAEAEFARKAVEEQLQATDTLIESLLRQSLSSFVERPLSECLREITAGIGEEWGKYPVLGATRSGVAPAKEPVGKNPHRYKPVVPGTIFYNPMRILLGSIAMIDDGEDAGITSPDYVVMTGVDRVLHPRWFYYWFRSKDGAGFIKSLSRGAVRERLLFKRLAPAYMRIPDWQAQETFANQLIDIRKFKKAMYEKLADIEKLPAALLREAFTGAT